MTTWNPCLNGDRIGTAYQETRYSYCGDDNTHTPHQITLRARACRLEWAPIPQAPMADDLFAALFGDA